MLEDAYSEKIVQTVKKLLVKYKLKVYDLNTKSGFVRHILVRKGFKTGEIMVVIVTTNDEFKEKEPFAKDLIEAHKEITTLVWNVNPTETPLFLGKKNTVLYGNGYITDELCGLSFRISPNSFYQVNPIQAETLYNLANEYALLTGNEIILDAYCGTGTIGLTMAKNAKKIIGVELNPEATNDAKENARLNNIENATFYNEDAGEFIAKLANKKEKIDIVITDPPRAGCSREFLKSLIALSPKRVVYISCNPDTLSRDIGVLTRAGYNVKKIQPVDMFPYTNHIECVVRLDRR
jgi:23S rRNA (uracil1939-C5)-methyltransferase